MQIELKSGRLIEIKGLNKKQEAKVLNQIRTNDMESASLMACEYGIELDNGDLENWSWQDIYEAGTMLVSKIQITPIDKKK